MPEPGGVPPRVGVEYAVGLGRRRAVVLRTGIDWWPGPFGPQAWAGVEVRWLGPPTTTHPSEQAIATVEIVHVSDVRVLWQEYVEREESKQIERARVERMTAEVYAAIGWDGEQRAGVVGVRVPLELVHAALVAAGEDLSGEGIASEPRSGDSRAKGSLLRPAAPSPGEVGPLDPDAPMFEPPKLDRDMRAGRAPAPTVGRKAE